MQNKKITEISIRNLLKFGGNFKSIFNVPRRKLHAVGINFYHVEAASFIKIFFILQKNACRLDNFLLLAKIYGFDGQAVFRA